MSERWRAAVAAALLAAAPAVRAHADVPTAGTSAPVQAQYVVYIHGLHVANVVADYQLQPWGYGVTTTLHAGGLMSMLLRINVRSTASGRFDNAAVVPASFDSAGYSRGANRHIAITYHDGTPDVTIHTPAETDRDVVPTSALPHAIDTLSAMALLLETMQKTGRCDGQAHIFDGIRLTTMQSHGPVSTTLPDGDDQAFHGPALRCDFVGQQVAGFVTHSSHLAEMRKPRPGSAWFQDVPGFGLVAVRIAFDHPKLGRLTAVLKAAPVHPN